MPVDADIDALIAAVTLADAVVLVAAVALPVGVDTVPLAADVGLLGDVPVFALSVAVE